MAGAWAAFADPEGCSVVAKKLQEAVDYSRASQGLGAWELSPALSPSACLLYVPGSPQLWRHLTARSLPWFVGFLIVVLGLLLRALGVCMWPCQTQRLLSQENLTGKV